MGRIRRDAFAVSTFAEMDKQDQAFWMRQTPQARLRAMELMRRVNYGQAAAERLQRLNHRARLCSRHKSFAELEKRNQ